MNTNQPPLVVAFLRHQLELWAYLNRKVHCVDTADDLLHDTFLRIAQLESGSAIVNPRAFLYRVAGNLALDHLRGQALRRARDGGELDQDWVCPLPLPDSVLAGRQAWYGLRRQIDALPVRQRNLLIKIRLGGDSYRQAARDERLAIKQVESTLRQALRSLQR